MSGTRIPVHLGERSYDIWVTQDSYRSLGGCLKRLNIGRTAVVVANPDAFRKHGHLLRRTLNQADFETTILSNFPSGEQSEKAKSWKYYLRLIRSLVRLENQKKKPFLICFAGGVLGDLTGFAAATFNRGIPYVQVPTTLLSQVDSAIGGKTAIDLPEAKNKVGAFYQPRLVYSDLSVLKSLPLKNLREGLAETIKYGVISSEPFFRFIERGYPEIVRRGPDLDALQRIVVTCSRIKARVVTQDERDHRGKRLVLNYGHTLGHALEAADFTVGHGNAISVGMILEAEISERLGLITKDQARRIENLLKAIGLPTTLGELYHRHITLDKILEAESYDKKFIQGRNRYVLPVKIGKVVVKEGIPYSLIRHVLKKRLA